MAFHASVPLALFYGSIQKAPYSGDCPSSMSNLHTNCPSLVSTIFTSKHTVNITIIENLLCVCNNMIATWEPNVILPSSGSGYVWYSASAKADCYINIILLY